MWSYAPWQGRYLPGSLSPRERLHAYATWCNAVEGNTTFYATPSLDTAKSWADQTAPDFRFLFKLPKIITHERCMADVSEPLHSFLAAIEPLGQRVHALWVQLPPAFGPADPLDPRNRPLRMLAGGGIKEHRLPFAPHGIDVLTPFANDDDAPSQALRPRAPAARKTEGATLIRRAGKAIPPLLRGSREAARRHRREPRPHP